MTSFQRRASQHDVAAVTLVETIFREHGYTGFVIGTETDNSALYAALRSQSDPTSVMLRFRPDRVEVKPGARSVLCEVKSESGKYPNFAIEMDSYKAALLWNQNYKHVMVAFVDLRAQKAYGIWVDELPLPQQIYIPERWDFAEQMLRMEKEWERVPLISVIWKGGSGTPYMLVRKDLPRLKELADFIEHVLTSRRGSS